ncbi:hypothetical protein RAS1_00610 [Phycisphaerae bacterium RAS1]|nr:hypothetical protein RAS1_00610 [Phycisphaerae bacterium RAS1]
MTDLQHAALPDQSNEPQRIPETYPPLPNVAPVRTFPIHWIAAPPVSLLALLAPRFVGPHAAAAGWLAALAVHFWALAWSAGVWAALGIEESSAAFYNAPSPSYPFIGHLFRPPAALAMALFMITDHWGGYLVIAVVIGLAQAAAWLGAIALMPLAWAGETRGRLYLRCVRLMFWGTAFLVPTAYATQPVVRYLNNQPWNIGSDRIREEVAIFGLALAGVAWGCSVLIRMAGRYPGQPLGPGWEARPPMCEACGYRLTMQPVRGACPECNRPVADSLPERRSAAPIAAVRWFVVPAFLWTTRASLAARRFARSYRLLDGQRAARAFAAAHCVLLGCFTAVAYLGVVTGRIDEDGLTDVVRNVINELLIADDLAEAALAGLAGGLAALGIFLVAALLATRVGWNTHGARATVICYAFAWIWLPVILASAGGLIHLRNARELGRLPHYALGGLVRVDLGDVAIAALYTPAAVCLLLWVLHYRRMLIEARFANA